MYHTNVELFLDRHLIGWEENVERSLCKPEKLPEPIIVSQYPWEQSYVTVYGSVLLKEDGSGFRMWYMSGAKGMTQQQFMCYAESIDGINWQKPLRSDHPYEGNTQTNIIHGIEANVHGPCVIRNQHNDNPEEKYLAFYDSYCYNGPEIQEVLQDCRWCYTATSPDGIKWSPGKGRPAVPGKPDCGQSVLWDPVKKCYLAYMRGTRHDMEAGAVRYVRLATSPDFLHWSDPIELLRLDKDEGDPRQQLHQFSVTKRGDQFVALRSIFHIDLFEIIPNRDAGPMTIETGTCDTQLAVSRDGYSWNCCADRDVFIPRGALGQWDSEWIVTASHIIFHNDQMLFYYASSNQPRKDMVEKGEACFGIGLATAPQDRFQTLRSHIHNQIAVIETKPLVFLQGDLKVNAAAQNGQITTELCDFNGQIIDGFSKEDCTIVQSDGLDQLVHWKGRRLSDAIDQTKNHQHAIRVRFYINNASLFAVYWPRKAQK
jgi:hypothetical protein